MSLNPKLIVSALCLALAPCVARATIYFRNTGTTSGWSSFYVEHNGSVTAQSTPHYDTTTSLRARQIYDSSYTGRYHAEARYSQGAKQGWDRYYGYCFYLPSNWQYVDQNFNIMQFIGTPSCATGGQPWTMLWIRNQALQTRITTGPDGCTRSDQNFTITSSTTLGTWHKVTIHGDWESNNTGWFSV
ncbi:MAG TPA: polysaccharide lyase, partial [Oscillatoriaceae cyanobacterium]